MLLQVSTKAQNGKLERQMLPQFAASDSLPLWLLLLGMGMGMGMLESLGRCASKVWSRGYELGRILDTFCDESTRY